MSADGMTPDDELTPEREIARIIGEACGAVSMAWNPRPYTQVFNSDEAAAVVDQAVRAVLRIMAGAWDGGYTEAIEASLPRYEPRVKWPNPYRTSTAGGEGE